MLLKAEIVFFLLRWSRFFLVWFFFFWGGFFLFVALFGLEFGLSDKEQVAFADFIECVAEEDDDGVF